MKLTSAAETCSFRRMARRAFRAHFQAMVVWLHPQPLELGKNYLLKHTVRTTRAQAVAIQHRVNVHTFAHEPAQRLEMNDIASVEFESSQPVVFRFLRTQPYDRQLHPD